jgi:N utilization substance protein A
VVIPTPVAVAAAPVEEEVGLKLSLNVPERAPVAVGSKSGVRFAEDILGRSGDSRVDKKKKKGKDDETGKGKKKRSGAGEFDTDEYD